jgi:LacI family transcriptional regulator
MNDFRGELGPDGEERARPLVCVSLPPIKRDRIIDVLIDQGWRPVSLAITGEAQMLSLQPPIALVDRDTDPHFVKKLLDQGCRVVKWCKFREAEDDQISTVTPDNIVKGPMAAEHLAERGFTTISCSRWQLFDKLNPMYEAFTKRGQELGLRVSVYGWKTDFDGKWWERYETHAQEFRNWLTEQGTPIGIFAADDRLAAVSCMYCIDLGLDVPIDVAILGAGDHPGLCKTSPVGISAIEMDEEEMVAQIVELLQRGLDGEPPSHVQYKPKGIVLRESTDVLASVDRKVAHALRFIWANYHRNISVDDIAEAIGMKRFELERSFRKELARGVGEELRRKRMDVFARLLETTDEPVADLCCQTGFFTPSHLFRMFKREFGMTPRHYRELKRGSSEA